MTQITFSGTRFGMTAAQNKNVAIIAVQVSDGDTLWRHGDCMGADDESHTIAYHLGFVIEIHPGDLPRKRAYAHRRHSTPTTLIHPPARPLQRNKLMVDLCDVLIAAPATMEEETRSGTWQTVRYARKQGKQVIICWPDGTITEEGRV